MLYPEMLRIFLWLCIQELCLAVLQELHEIPGIEPGQSCARQEAYTLVHLKKMCLLEKKFYIELTVLINQIN